MMSSVCKSSLRPWIVLLITLFTASPALAIQPCEFGEDVQSTRPIPPDRGPTEIYVGLFIFDLVDIATVKQQFTLDFFVDIEWNDDRLGEKLREAGETICQVSKDQIWTPGILFLNSRAVRFELPKVFLVHDDGTIEGEQRIVGTFASPFDLRNFPMDSQTLTVTWISTKYGPHELRIIYFEGEGMREVFSEAAWLLQDTQGESSAYGMELVGEDRGVEREQLSRFDFRLLVKRQANFYLWKVVLPLCMIVMVSWAVFWIDPIQLGVQVGIGTAMMLTIIAFLFSLQKVLPPISYLTRLDYFVFGALVFVFLAFVEALLTCTLAAHGWEVQARRIDRWARFVFPLALAAGVIWFWHS